MMVIGLVVGGLPLFFAATDNAEAAVGVWEKRDKALSITDSHGYLTVDVSTFVDEGSKPIQGYTLLLKWDACRKDLNPLSGFWRTLRSPQTATITTDAKGEAEYKVSIPNMCWTENLWIYGSSDGWQNVEYFLGNIASTKVRLDIQTQASMATQHAIQRADTLGIIEEWYDLTDTPFEKNFQNKYFNVQTSQLHSGSTMVRVNTVSNTPRHPPYGFDQYYQTQLAPLSAVGMVDKKITTYSNVSEAWSVPAGTSDYRTINDMVVVGPFKLALSGRGYSTDIYANDALIASYPKRADDNRVWFDLNLPEGTYDFKIQVTATEVANPIYALYTGTVMEFILTGISKDVNSATICLINYDEEFTIDLSGRFGNWQVSGQSTTLTYQDLVPVSAHIRGIYPLVISNPRWDRTPIADSMNGLKFDVYNIRNSHTTETINLALTTDNGTQVWATTVGSKTYPPWADESQFTTVHLTDVFMPAEPRKEYALTISSGGAITEIPVVFYPAELDPDVVYEPKRDLDDIIKDYGTVNAAALKAYHDWAASMQPRIEVIKSDIGNYSKFFEDRAAVDNLALANAAASRGLELITGLKEICRGDGSDTSIGELTSHAQGIWSSYQAALLYRETAIAYEAGQDAFGNRTALDAWYQDLVSKRITTGLTDQKQGDDPNSVAVWVGVAVALVVGGLVMYLCWKYIVPPLKSMLPKGRTKRMRTIRTITPVAVTVVLAILIALVAFLATWNIALSIEAALR